MPRSRIFLALVLILLAINTIFFVSWYALGGRNAFRNYLTQQLGKVIKGKVSAKELHVSDRQLIAGEFTLSLADSSLYVRVEKLQVQYNLWSFIFSGFKTKHLIKSVEITRPDVAYSLIPKHKAKKAHKPFRIPDLKNFFKTIAVHDGRFRIYAGIPLKIITPGTLQVTEQLTNININVVNTRVTKVNLEANSIQGGHFTVFGVLDKGVISNAEAEINNYHPLLVHHPDILNFDTELTTVATLSQDSLKAPFHYQGKAQLWGTQALFASKYPVHMPYLNVNTDGKNLSADLSRSRIGNSDLKASASIANLGRKMTFKSASLDGNIDLSMITPKLNGMVAVDASGSGSIADPKGVVKATSNRVSYARYSFDNISLDASYASGLATFSLPNLAFQNQITSLEGTFDPRLLALTTTVQTHPRDETFTPYTVLANLDLFAQLADKYPLVNASIHNLDLHYNQLNVKSVSGEINLAPYTADGSYYLDADLSGSNGYALKVAGDLLKRNFSVDAAFQDLQPAGIFPQPTLTKFNPLVSGSARAIMTQGVIHASTDLDLTLQQTIPYHTTLQGIGSYSLNARDATLYLDARQGMLNDKPLDFTLGASLSGKTVKVYGLKVNDQISLSGTLDTSDLKSSEFSLGLWDVSTTDITGYFPSLLTSIPDFSGLNLFADYNLEHTGLLDARLDLPFVDLLAITPLGLGLSLHGPLTQVALQGEIHDQQRHLIDLSGYTKVKMFPDLTLEAAFNDLVLQNLIMQSPVTGSASGKGGITWRNIGQKGSDMDIMADLDARKIQAGSFNIDQARVIATQFARKLQVDSLEVHSPGLFDLTAKGAIDYNAIKNEFFEGDNQLDIDVTGQLFSWLKDLTHYIQESSGRSSLSCTVTSQDEQFMITGGKLDISGGHLKLKDQPEPITDITIQGIFDKNRVIIERGQAQMGKGKLIFNNIFEADNTDHFILGFIDLGILRLLIDDPGIQFNIPLFSPKNTISTITLKGRNGRYATVKGPFDQMSISADVTLSNASAVYPPNTDNLLKLANSVRTSTRNPDQEAVPLPFNLDVMINLGENVKYITYPANISLNPGGFLHLLYDGQKFSVEEARFTSERGTIDIFGSVFQASKVDILMVDAQNLFNVEGVFYKRAPDGTLITLKAETSNDLTKSLMERLQFSLTSDNPEDRSISQILTRLRYNGQSTTTKNSTDPNAASAEGGLQDEALLLLSDNLDASLLTPILSPVETFMRRKLKLDDFSINAGFIQNLYTQYSTDSSQFANYTKFDQFSTDIAQFSSSILLNNLSLSMSKYLGSRFFLDYKLELQEATDLQKKTALMVSHGTSVRVMLPWQLRLGYTFEYTPHDKLFTHEVMLQRSWRFWGF